MSTGQKREGNKEKGDERGMKRHKQERGMNDRFRWHKIIRIHFTTVFKLILKPRYIGDAFYEIINY